MNIQKRPNGSWRARYRDDTGHEISRHFKTKREAQRHLDEVKASIVTGQYVDPTAGRATFATFFESWLEMQVYTSNTVKAMRLAAQGTTFRDVPLNRLRRSHVAAWVKHMDVSGLQPSTIHTRFTNVRTVLRAAVADRLISGDPSDQVRLPARGRRETSMRIPTSPQVGALLATCPEEFRAFVALCAFGGLRLGEAAAIRGEDIDFLRGRLTIERQVQRAGGGAVEVREPKYGSVRTIYLPEALKELLSVHLERFVLPTERRGYLFSGADGCPPHQNTVGHRWRSAVRRAGVEGVRLHDLRHYYASGLIAAGCDVVTVQKALGHGKATTTLDTYAHLWPTAEDRTRAAAASMMAESTGSVVTSDLIVLG